MLKKFSILFFIVISCTGFSATYYSDSGGGDPNNVNKWWTATNNTGSHPSDFNTSSDIFILQAGHSYTTTNAWSVGSSNAVTLQVNGTLTIQTANTIATFTITSGGQVTGTAQTTIRTSFNINNGGKYILNNSTSNTSTTLFAGTESFGATSTFEIQNMSTTAGDFGSCIAACTGTFPGIINWNIQAGSTAYILHATASTTYTISGDLTISQTGAANGGSVAACGNVASPVLVVTGTCTLNGGKFYLGSTTIASNSATLTLNDFVIANGTTFDISPGGSASSPILNLKGNLTNSGTGIFKSTTFNATINFNGSGSTQIYNNSSSGYNKSGLKTWTVASGAVVRLASNLVTAATSSSVDAVTVSGTLIFGTGSTDGSTNYYVDVSSSSSDAGDLFTLNSGGILKITSSDGITYSATLGNIRTSGSSARYSLNAGGIYHYVGDAVQNTGDALPASISGQLIINNTSSVSLSGVSLSQATTITGTVTLTAGILTTTSANLLTINNTSTSSISSGSSTTFVSGPIKWIMATSSASTYVFPTGKGGRYLPYSFGNYTATTPNITAEAFATFSAGSVTTPASSFLGGEYWTVTYATNAITNGYVSIGKSSSLGSYTLVGTAATVNGVYSSLGGSISGNTITGTTSVGAIVSGTTRYYAMIAGGACSTYSGTITVGPTATFNSLTHGLAVLKSCGYTGSIILELQSNYDGTSNTETFPIVFTSSGNFTPSSIKTVTIQPASGVSSSLTITGSSTTSLIQLNAVTYITFDGRPGGSGSNKYLTISNTSTATGGSAVQLINDASNNTIKYCDLTSSYLSSTAGVIEFSTTTGTTGNDNNLITYCLIDGGAGATVSPTTGIAINGIYSYGTSAKTNSGNQVTYCEIFDMFNSNASGVTSFILLDAYNDSWTFDNNSFYQTSTRTATGAHTINGIRIDDGSGYVITSNYFGGNAALCSGTWTQNSSSTYYTIFYGINLAVGTSSSTSVQGNTFKGLTWDIKGTSNEWAPIYVTSGNVNIGTTSGNIIGATTGTSTIQLVNTTGTPLVYGIYSSSTGTVSIQNNIIGAISTCNTNVSFTVYGIKTSGAAGIYTISSNTIGSNTTANSITVGGTSTTSGVSKFYGIDNSATGLTTISSNTIKNCTVYGTSTTATLFYGINNTGGADNSVISSNTISTISNTGSSAGSGGSSYGINQSAVATMSVSNNTISSFTIDNGQFRGISFVPTTSSSKTYTVTSNTIKTITAAATTGANTVGDYCGVYISSTGNTYNLNTNLIQSLTGTTTTSNYYILGIYSVGVTTQPVINMTGNIIQSIENYSTATGSSNYIGGIEITSTSSTASLYKKNIVRKLYMDAAGTNSSMAGISISSTSNTLVNNFVKLTNSQDGTTDVTLRVQMKSLVLGASSTNVLYYNTIVMGGNSGAASNNGDSYALFIGNSSTNTLKNNIIQNTRAHSTNHVHRCLQIGSTNSCTNTLSNNYYVGVNTTNYAVINGSTYTNATYSGGSGSTNATTGLTIAIDAAVTETGSITGITDLYTAGGTDCREDLYANTSIRNVSGQAGGHQGCYEAGQGNYYWVAGTGNWSDYSNHWAYVSGGPACAIAVPSTTSNVYFDANSSAGICTIDAAATCLDFTGTGYTGTIAGTFGLTISGSLTIGSGMTWSHTGTTTFNATSAGKTITPNSVSVACPLTFNGSGGGWTLAGNLTTTSTNAFTLTTGTLSLASYTLSIAGDFTKATAFTFTPSTGTVNFTGNSSSINGTTGSPTFYNLTLNKTTGQTLGLGGSATSITCSNNLTITTGTLAVGAFTVTVTGASVNSGTITLSTGTYDANGSFDGTGGAVTFSDDGFLYLGGAVTSLGSLTNSWGANATTGSTVVYDYAGAQSVAAVDYYNLTINGSGTKTLAGNIDIGGSNGEGVLTVASGCTFAIGDNTITHIELHDFSSTYNSAVVGTVTLNNGNWTPTYGQNAQLVTSGSITVTGTGIIYLRGGGGHTLGTLTPGSGTVYYTRNGTMNVQANTFNHLIIAGTSGAKTLAGNVTVNGDFTNSSSGSSFSASSYTLTSKGNFINDATFNAGTGTVTFNGTSAQSLSGTTDPAFYNVTMNHSSTGVTASLNFSITNTLTLTAGKLIVQGYTLILGVSGSSAGTVSGGGSSTYVVAYDNSGTIGYFKRFTTATGVTYALPIGDATNYLPVNLNYASATLSNAYLTAYTKASKVTGLSSSITNYINRSWEVTPTGASSYTYTIDYTFVTGDVVGSKAGMLPIKLSGSTWYKPTSTLFTTGTAQGSGSFDGAFKLTWSGLTTFSLFGGAVDQAVALPVELLTFDLKPYNNNVKLNWKTASEINNDYFLVERSADGSTFKTIAKVDGAGNSTHTISYYLIDQEFEKTVNYYRLIQIDFNGSQTPSEVLSIDMSKHEGVIVMTVNTLGQEVNQSYSGVVFDIYSDGSSVKRIQ